MPLEVPSDAHLALPGVSLAGLEVEAARRWLKSAVQYQSDVHKEYWTACRVPIPQEEPEEWQPGYYVHGVVPFLDSSGVPKMVQDACTNEKSREDCIQIARANNLAVVGHRNASDNFAGNTCFTYEPSKQYEAQALMRSEDRFNTEDFKCIPTDDYNFAAISAYGDAGAMAAQGQCTNELENCGEKTHCQIECPQGTILHGGACRRGMPSDTVSTFARSIPKGANGELPPTCTLTHASNLAVFSVSGFEGSLAAQTQCTAENGKPECGKNTNCQIVCPATAELVEGKCACPSNKEFDGTQCNCPRGTHWIETMEACACGGDNDIYD